jgi:DNA repair exonuclease SbcCD ATPase subunit
VKDLDALIEVLRAASAEGHLSGQSLAILAEALRERAEAVLHRRVRELERENEALRTETAWRNSEAALVAKELTDRKDEIARKNSFIDDLERAITEHEARARWQDENVSNLESTIAGLRRERDSALGECAARARNEDALERLRSDAAAAHDRLLAHHHASLQAIAESVAAIASRSGPMSRRIGADLEALAKRLRAESEGAS